MNESKEKPTAVMIFGEISRRHTFGEASPFSLLHSIKELEDLPWIKK